MNVAEILGNDFFSGGLALGALGVAAAYGRRYLGLAASYAYRRIVAEVEVRDGEMVNWLGLWLAHTPYGLACRRLSTYVFHQEGDQPVLFFEPGIGPHVFRYEGTWVILDRQREQPGPGGPPTPKELYMLRVIGPRERAAEILEKAKAFSIDLLSRSHVAFISDGHGGWDRLTVGVPRKLESVIVPGTLAADVAEDIRSFLGRRAWYAERGIPWRRGYLFDGPPGTGKTSLVRALAHELGLPLYYLDLTAKEFSDRALAITLSRLPKGAALLVEDIDEQLEPKKKASYVTLSGLLNALDGPLAGEGRILFITTNVRDRLDAALDRPGRVDVRVHLGPATSEQVERLFLRFFPGRTEDAAAFAAAIPDGVLPPAAVQGYLAKRSEDPERAIAEAAELARQEVRVVARGRSRR